ncbi:MAG: hypothetical protein Q8P27_02625, partial [Candidatus Peregrinibacteria bacterium]|nr:hypothetical protein [Candidatus Peregrinibacteria bacterium]
MSKSISPKPAYVKAGMWMLFSGTAMFSAFVLPIHIWMFMDGKGCGSDGCVYVGMRLDEWWFKAYFVILVGAALYHSFYRVKT